MAKGLIWLLRLSLRSLIRNKLRTLLTVLGIMLGVSILLAINLANDMALRNFKDSVDRVAGRSNLTIRPTQTDSFDEALLSRLRWLWQVPGQMSPGLEQTALWVPSDKLVEVLQSVQSTPPVTPTREVVQVLGIDMLDAFKTGPTEMTLIAQTPEAFHILDAPYAYIGETLAQTHQVRVGQSFQLYINDHPQAFRVAGILSKGGLGAAYGGNLVVMDIGNAQAAFQLQGRLNKIDIQVPEVLLPLVQAKIQQVLPRGVSVQRPSQRSAQVEKMIQAYRYNLTMLSFIALLVGVFLIYNTMSITIIRRRPEIGTLRALGMARSQIFLLFMGEALLIGGVGTVLGLGFGVFLSQFAVKAVATTIASLYTGQVLDTFAVNPWLLLQGLVFGLMMTLLGAVAPVLEAMAVSPAEASRRASYETRIERFAGRLGWWGVGLAALALLAAWQPAVNGLPVFGFVSALAAILAVALWMPTVLKVTLTALLPLLSALFKTEGRLSALILRGALGRTAVAVASLMIGIAMMVSLAVMIGSFRQTVISWVNQTIRADLWIQPVSRFDSKQTGRLQSQWVEQIRAMPGVKAVDTFYEFPIEYKGNPTRLGIGDFAVLGRYGRLLFLNHEKTETVIQRALSHPAVIVTEAFATRNNVRAGQTIALDTAQGSRPFKVEAVYYDYSSDLGYIIMPRRWYQQFYRDNKISNLAVYLAPGVSTEGVRQALYQKMGAQRQLDIRSNQELRDEVLRVFDRTFSITYALHVIAIAVALLSIMNALFALVLEARREFGILKYLGASAGQIGRIVFIQAGLLGLFGNVAGLTVGMILSYLLIHVINKQSFGWTLNFDLPVAFLTQAFLLVLGTALLAGLIPARLAAKTPAPDVIKSE